MVVAVQGLVLALLALIAGACADRAEGIEPMACIPEKRGELGAGALACTPRCAQVQESEDVDLTRRPVGETEVEVVVHLMNATIGDPIRKGSNAGNLWKLAPIGGAVAGTVLDVEYWTPGNLSKFFGLHGEVDKIWKRHGIRVVLAGVEDCDYKPGLLKYQGTQIPDSIRLTPEDLASGAVASLDLDTTRPVIAYCT